MTTLNIQKVHVVILNWNGLEDTLMCLSSLYKSQYDNYKVVVIDNNSTKNELKIIQKKFPEVHGIQCKSNLGFTGGCNLGIEYALKENASFIWLLNNDALVFPETMQNLVTELQEDHSIGMISPVIFDKEFKYIENCGSYIDFETLQIVGLKSIDEYIELKKKSHFNIALWGTALLIKREVIENVGYFDNRYFAYAEDQDLSIQVLRNGWKNSVSINASICHGKVSSKSNLHKEFYMVRNRYLLLSKHSLPKYRIINLANFISNLLLIVDNQKHIGKIDLCVIYLDALWNALWNNYGDWKNRTIMPSIFKNLLLWRPMIFYKLSRVVNILIDFISGINISKNWRYDN